MHRFRRGLYTGVHVNSLRPVDLPANTKGGSREGCTQTASHTHSCNSYTSFLGRRLHVKG
jgi:hypothetical protein